MKKFLGAVLVATALLTGCSAISEGRIMDKIYSEPYETTQMQCMSRNKEGLCTLQMPVTNHHPASYKFDIEDGKDTGWVYVDKYEYESHEVGDWYGGSN